MSSSWTPDPSGLQQLIEIFTGTLSNDYETRKAATTALDQATVIPDFDNYLLHILLSDRDSYNNEISMTSRANAGLFLKNDLLKNWSRKQPELQNHILTMLPHGLITPLRNTRHITAIVIASLLRKLTPQGWPNVIPNIMELLDGAAGDDGRRGALEVLTLVTEDSGRLLDRDIKMANGSIIRPTEMMIPRLVTIMGNNSISSQMRTQAAKCLVNCVNVGSMVIQVNLDNLLSQLFSICQEGDTVSNELKKEVAALFCGIQEQWQTHLYLHWDGIIAWMTHIIKHGEETAALQACEFLLGMSTRDTPKELIFPILGDITPVLLSKMVYDEDDVILMENEDERDHGEEDKDEDIKPQMAKSKEHTVSKKEEESNNRNDESDDSDDDEDDEEDDFDNSYTWNLRKCSAATIDILSGIFPVEILTIAFPIIKNNMVSPDWPIREAAILTLGAISEAGLENATAQLPELIQFLVERLHDNQPRVRQITCWTLGRYSSWVCSEALANGAFANYFAPTFTSIMDGALDTKKVVQESACSALADFIESADRDLLREFIDPLLQHFQIYFQRYRRKNLLVLYDTVQTFVEKVGDILQYSPNYIDILLPPLITKWQALEDNDKDLWPLLECMSSVAASLGEGFANYALPVYERAIRILHNCIEQDRLATTQPGFEAPEKDFIVTSLDLIDGLIQGLSTHSAQLIEHGDQNKQFSLMELVITCFDDPSDDVRQSAYAVLGDIAIHLHDKLIIPYVQPIMLSIGNEISLPNESAIAARNNSIWSLGEISLRLPNEQFQPYLERMTQQIISVLHNINGSEDPTLIENAAITLGRFGINNSIQIVQYIELANVIPTWCEVMSHAEENEEKETAFMGMSMVISSKPDLLINNMNNLQPWLQCVTYYNIPGDELGNLFLNLLQGLKGALGADWEQIILVCGVEGVLKSKYNV